MKNDFYLLVSILMCLGACGADKDQTATEPAILDEPGSVRTGMANLPIYRKMSGAVGGNPVVVDLQLDDSVFSGRYYYERIGAVIGLQGRLNSDGRMELTEYSQGRETGRFDGQWSTGTLSGQWRSPLGKSVDFSWIDDLRTGAEITFLYREKERCPSPEQLKAARPDDFLQPQCSRLEVSVPQIKVESAEVTKAVNRALLQHICIMEGGKAVTTIDEYVSAELPDEDQEFAFEKGFVTTILTNESGLLSIGVVYWIMNQGAAHPMPSVNHLNFDLATGKMLGLDDILRPGYRAALDTLGERQFVKVYGREGFEITPGQFQLSDDFSIQRDGLVFYFDVYEIGPYSAGVQEVFLPFAALGEWLKPGKMPSSWLSSVRLR